MKSISDYKKRVSRQGGIKNTIQRHSKHTISAYFKHTPSYEEVYLNDSTEMSPVQIVTDTKTPTLKTILMYPGTIIKAGNMVKRNNGEVWLCLSDDPNEIYISGKIERCNFTLKWIDSAGILRSIPSVLYFNARSNFGVEEDKVMNLPAGRRQITVSSNENTVKIERDARFIIGSEAFKVIDTDYMSDDGLVNLSLQSDQINPSVDNLELGIADYNKLTRFDLTILNDNPLALSIGQQARVSVRVLKDGKQQLDDPKVQYTSSQPEVVDIDNEGNLQVISSGEVIITVSGYGLTKELKLYVSPTLHYDYDATIDGANEIYLNRESTYVANFFNNGIKIADESSFSLTNLDGTPTLLASITSQDPIANTCVVRANSNRKLGTVILHVHNANGLSHGQKEIKIKSLI